MPADQRRIARPALARGEGDRGARRIITGSAGELYWTPDHCATFSVIQGGGR